MDVLLPFHRNDEYFNVSLRSVLESQDINLRLILIDDRVNKNQKILIPKSKSHSVEYIETSGGLGYGLSLEIGSRAIQSDYMALMNSDDLITPNRFARQASRLNKSNLCLSNIKRVRDNGKKSHSLLGDLTCDIYDPIFLIFGAYGANATLSAQTSWWEKNSFFDSAMALDWRIALKTYPDAKIAYIPESLYLYRRHQNQSSSGLQELNQVEPIFELWSQLCAKYKISEVSIENFIAAAMPWNFHINISLEKFKVWGSSMHDATRVMPPQIVTQINRLFSRRLILSSFNVSVSKTDLLKESVLHPGSLFFLAKDYFLR